MKIDFLRRRCGNTPQYPRVARAGKHAALILCLPLCAALFEAACAASPQTVTIPRASSVVLGVLGVHTHADYLLFDTGTRDFSRVSPLTLRAFCRLPTDRAALPPDLAAFSRPGDPPLPNPYGPISGGGGRPGWTALPEHRGGRNVVRVLVPTRFANWLAAQPPARRRAYRRPDSYSLRIGWE